MVSNWEPAHSLVEDARLWGRDCPLPSISDCSTPASLPPVGCGRGLALLWCSFNPVFCEPARMCIRLEPSMENFSLFFSSLAIPQFGLLYHVSALRLSSGHSGPALTLSMQRTPPCLAPPLASGQPERLGYLSAGSCVSLGKSSVGFFFFFSSCLCCPLRFKNFPQTRW